MAEYRLTYFNARGRAECSRLLFTVAGKTFDDRRVDADQWKELKPNTKFGQLPMLEVNGKQFGQSRAIVNFLAREFGLYGKTNLEKFAIDEVVSIVEDFLQVVVKVHFEKDDDKKAELGKNLKENEIPKFFGWFEKLLKESGTGYFVGNAITLADVSCFDFVSNVEKSNAGCADKYPLLKAFLTKIGEVDSIKKYLESRPVTAF